jgi:hypothetical protein
MSPGYVPHEAVPQPPSIHSVNPETAGRHVVTEVKDADPLWCPLEALCASCGQPILLLTLDGAWMHQEVQREPFRMG